MHNGVNAFLKLHLNFDVSAKIKTVSPKRVVTIVPFRTISGNFLANPFDIFHKTVALLIQND